LLINKLNASKGNLIPLEKKQALWQKFQGRKGLGLSAARDLLLNWVLDSQPLIAGRHGVADQAADTLQHYRFGLVQADNLIELAKTNIFAEDPSRKMLALFTSVHDLGRLLVGSGASCDKYPAEGNLLHPIVGAMMLRETFAPLQSEISGELLDLFQALVITAERHTLSLGLMPSQVAARNIPGIEAQPYQNFKGSLLMSDVEMGTYGKYAHLAALADLINNVCEKGMPGVAAYDSLVGVEGMTAEERLEYLLRGPGNGECRVVKYGEQSFTNIFRLWRNMPAQRDCWSWRAQMEKDATQYLQGLELPLGQAAFMRGWSLALGNH
jgi:hypothetical protein